MLTKIPKTNFPPVHKNIFIWDGECGFCKYWITRWKAKTQGKLVFQTFQEAAQNFPDIPLKEFKKASRLIETDGSIYSGPDSAYRSFVYFENKITRWHLWYKKYKWFRDLSDHTYNFIAKNRALMFRLTKIFFGNDPENLKPYWIVYLSLLVVFIFVFLKFL